MTSHFDDNSQIYQAAIKKWGYGLQIEIAIEECAELIKALQKLKRSSELLDWEQLKMIFSRQIIEEYKIQKIERLKQRIEEDPRR